MFLKQFFQMFRRALLQPGFVLQPRRQPSLSRLSERTRHTTLHGAGVRTVGHPEPQEQGLSSHSAVTLLLHCCYTVATQWLPVVTLLSHFSLFNARTVTLPQLKVDHVVGWGCFPLVNSNLKLVEGKFKVRTISRSPSVEKPLAFSTIYGLLSSI
jgi:hypothetical protein